MCKRLIVSEFLETRKDSFLFQIQEKLRQFVCVHYIVVRSKLGKQQAVSKPIRHKCLYVIESCV